jgi:hypothetical protein
MYRIVHRNYSLPSTYTFCTIYVLYLDLLNSIHNFFTRTSENLPLRYFVSDKKLPEHGCKITDHPMSDEDVISFTMFKVQGQQLRCPMGVLCLSQPQSSEYFPAGFKLGFQEWRIPAEVAFGAWFARPTCAF